MWLNSKRLFINFNFFLQLNMHVKQSYNCPLWCPYFSTGRFDVHVPTYVFAHWY